MSVWDDPELQPDGDYINFIAVGDTCAGTIQRVDVKRWDDGTVSPQIHLLCDDNVERTLTAGQIKLKAALVEQRPEPGDHITVTLTQIEKRSGGKTLKHFQVDVAKGGTPVAAWPAAAPADVRSEQTVFAAQQGAPIVDQAALAAAVANLTAEQRAALGVG